MSDIAATKKAEGNAYFAKKMYKEAADCYTQVSVFSKISLSHTCLQAIEHDPSNHILYSNRAMAYSAMCMWKEAKADGLACIERNKEFLKGYHRAANAMINLVCFIDEYKVG